MEKLIKGCNSTTKEIGRKVDEIVAWIDKHENVGDTNATGTDGQNAGALAAADQYPNFEKWKKDAIRTDAWSDGEFLKLAPENFYVVKNGKRKDYFTWDEAMEYEEKVLKPNGWRLPTCQEWAKICACYIDKDGCDDVKRFMEELKMEKLSYIDMDGVKNASGQVYGVAGNGYFWSSSSVSVPYARGLLFGSHYLDPQRSYYKGNGFSVRCVKEPKNEL